MSQEQADIRIVVEQVLERDPLYARVKVTRLPERHTDLYPDVLFLKCSKCKQERPFRDLRSRGGGAGMPEPILKTDVYHFRYMCTGCESTTLQCWIEVNKEEGWLRKVGQLPPWDIGISWDVERFLGEDAQFYKRARICISQSYGLAACAYLRRVLENQINGVLILIREIQVEEGSQEKVAKLDELLHSKNLDDKLSEAYRYAPNSIIVEGSNPLKLIYENLSDRIHNKSEEECVRCALEVSTAFEFIVVELARHKEARGHYAERIRELSRRQRQSSP
jgi:hypothetical protein